MPGANRTQCSRIDSTRSRPHFCSLFTYLYLMRTVPYYLHLLLLRKKATGKPAHTGRKNILISTLSPKANTIMKSVTVLASFAAIALATSTTEAALAKRQDAPVKPWVMFCTDDSAAAGEVCHFDFPNTGYCAMLTVSPITCRTRDYHSLYA